jgi:flagellar motility protein MotE (MotC chaperone)
MSKPSRPKGETTARIDVDEIMRDIRATIDHKRRSGAYREVVARLSQPTPPAASPPPPQAGQGLSMQRLSDKWTLPRSHRGGPFGHAAGWLLRKLFGAVQIFLAQIFAVQEQNNQQLAAAVARQDAALAETTRDMANLKDALAQNLQEVIGMQQDINRIIRDTVAVLHQVEAHRKTLDLFDQIFAEYDTDESLERKTKELIEQIGSNARAVERLTAFQEEIQARLDLLDGQQLDNRRLLMRAVRQQTPESET